MRPHRRFEIRVLCVEIVQDVWIGYSRVSAIAKPSVWILDRHAMLRDGMRHAPCDRGGRKGDGHALKASCGSACATIPLPGEAATICWCAEGCVTSEDAAIAK